MYVAKLAKNFVNRWQNGEAKSFENKISRMSLPDCTILNWPQTRSVLKAYHDSSTVSESENVSAEYSVE